MLFIFKAETGRRRYSTDKKLLFNLIQENKIEGLERITKLEKGDYVTCCTPDKSLDPHGLNLADSMNYAWVRDKVIKVEKVTVLTTIYYVVGENAKSGIHVSGLRYSTKEEIEKWEKEH